MATNPMFTPDWKDARRAATGDSTHRCTAFSFNKLLLTAKKAVPKNTLCWPFQFIREILAQAPSQVW